MLKLEDPKAARVRERLQKETLIWLTTVTSDGQPQASLVWFLWEGEEFLIYSQPKQGKLANLAANPRVALHFNSNAEGGEVATFEGTAAVDGTAPPADKNAAYIAKYQARIKALGWTPESFAADYSRAVRIKPRRLRHW